MNKYSFVVLFVCLFSLPACGGDGTPAPDPRPNKPTLRQSLNEELDYLVTHASSCTEDDWMYQACGLELEKIEPLPEGDLTATIMRDLKKVDAWQRCIRRQCLIADALDSAEDDKEANQVYVAIDLKLSCINQYDLIDEVEQVKTCLAGTVNVKPD